MARRLDAVLAGGDSTLRAAVWEFLRPMHSPRPAAQHRDAFVVDDGPVTTVDLAAYPAASDLDDLELGEDEADVSAA